MIFNPAHPGEVLKDYWGDMTVAEASRRLGVTRAHLSRILNGRAGISASMPLRLSILSRNRGFYKRVYIASGTGGVGINSRQTLAAAMLSASYPARKPNARSHDRS